MLNPPQIQNRNHIKGATAIPTFVQLWNHHPANLTPPVIHPCTDKDGNVPGSLENQCAIRLGLAFQACGVDTNGVHGARCWLHHGRKHILRVADIVPWIDRHEKLIGCREKTVHHNVTFLDFVGKFGIVYFQNFYGRHNQGDHVDLWNGLLFRVAHGDLDYFQRSEEVWFWEF